MSFTNPVKIETNSRCWDRSYKWAGGMKDVKKPDGTLTQELRANIKSWNSEAKENDYFPPEKKMAIIGFTTGLTGFNGKEGDGAVRYYSNEVLDTWTQPMTLRASGANGTTTLFQDELYEAFKDKKPAGCRYTVFLYFYDFDTKKVNRFELVGSSVGPWFDLEKDNNILHKRWLCIRPGETKKNGTAIFIVPELYYGDVFTQAEIDEIVNSPAYVEYDKFEKKIANGMSTGEMELGQTPAQYEGEASQEYPDASTAQSNTTDLSNVPF